MKENIQKKINELKFRVVLAVELWTGAEERALTFRRL